MTNQAPAKAVPAQLTPAERAARKADAQAKKFLRDRARMLAHVKTCVQQAETAIAAGDVAKHDQWLDSTTAAITSYRQFVALTLNVQAASAPFTLTNAD